MAHIGLIESSLGEGQLCLLSGRMRTRHLVSGLEEFEGCGFAAIEVFGGGSFQIALEELGEDPFERLRQARAVSSAKLLGSIAGQSLVGTRPYPDDVVGAFVERAAESGLDIFRCFDPLNDARNLSVAAAAVRAAGKQAEAGIIYSESPAHSIEQLLEFAALLPGLGFESLCVLDPSGLLGAGSAARLIGGLVQQSGLPVGLRASSVTGQAPLAYLAAAQAGASSLDVCLSPLGGGCSPPSTEGVYAALRGTEFEPELDQARLTAAVPALRQVVSLYPCEARSQEDGEALSTTLAPLVARLLRGEAAAQGVAEQHQELLGELARVREELGFPALVSPIGELVALQAVANVASGERYLTVPQEVRDYLLGLYGEPPAPPDPEIRGRLLGAEVPISVRPGTVLDPGLELAARQLARADHPDAGATLVLEFALFPGPTTRMLRGEVHPERLPDEPEPQAEAGRESAPVRADGGELSEPVGDAAAIPLAAPPPAPPPAPEPVEQAPMAAREFSVEVDGELFEVRVVAKDGGGFAAAGTAIASPAAAAQVMGAVKAPMQGLIARVSVKVGDQVQVGQTVVVLEAMKMQNDIPSELAGTVRSVDVTEGQVVGRGDLLVTVG